MRLTNPFQWKQHVSVIRHTQPMNRGKRVPDSPDFDLNSQIHSNDDLSTVYIAEKIGRSTIHSQMACGPLLSRRRYGCRQDCYEAGQKAYDWDRGS